MGRIQANTHTPIQEAGVRVFTYEEEGVQLPIIRDCIHRHGSSDLCDLLLLYTTAFILRQYPVRLSTLGNPRRNARCRHDALDRCIEYESKLYNNANWDWP